MYGGKGSTLMQSSVEEGVCGKVKYAEGMLSKRAMPGLYIEDRLPNEFHETFSVIAILCHRV